jgi:deferrochelatase/peroxidase EfeB
LSYLTGVRWADAVPNLLIGLREDSRPGWSALRQRRPGPRHPADGLTVTVSAGSTLFDDGFGLAAAKPKRLTPMLAFPNDSPVPVNVGSVHT